MRAAVLALLALGCTPSSSQEGTKVTPPASASATPSADTPTASDGPDQCRTDKDCPGRPVKVEGLYPPVVAQECCLQGGEGAAQDHLACQDAHSKRACVHVCLTDADCYAPATCKPWGKDGRRACQ